MLNNFNFKTKNVLSTCMLSNRSVISEGRNKWEWFIMSETGKD